ncbi:hypothetical protein AHF37_12617 [Paragonimus kellicotti]|nr:hypothetical protein AHF37_12617 [Paragonimus kellicotti]
MTIGAMLESWLTKLDWFSTLFPRIPVPVQKKLEEKLRIRRSQKLMQTPAHVHPNESRRTISHCVREKDDSDHRKHSHAHKGKHQLYRCRSVH